MIYLHIRQEELSRAVNDIISVCEQTKLTAQAVPYFSFIRIDGLGEAIRLSAHNTVRRVEVMMKVTPHEPFTVGVKGPHLKSVLSALPKEELTISISGSKMTVGYDQSLYELETIDSSAFPEHAPVEVPRWMSVNLGTMLNDILQISYCTSILDADPVYRKAVVITMDNIICTDGFRLSHIPNSYFHCKEVLLFPADAIKCFESLFRGRERGNIYSDGNRIHFSSGGIYASTALLAGTAPNFRSVIKQSDTSSLVELSGEDFRFALSRLFSVTSSIDKASAVTGDFHITEKGITVNVDTQGFKATEFIPVKKGLNVTMRFNLKFLLQALKTLGDNLVIEIRGKELPVVIRNESPFVKNVVMPHKI